MRPTHVIIKISYTKTALASLYHDQATTSRDALAVRTGQRSARPLEHSRSLLASHSAFVTLSIENLGDPGANVCWMLQIRNITDAHVRSMPCGLTIYDCRCSHR